MGSNYYYRVELSGGHTGSARFYDCLVTGQRAAVVGFLGGCFGDPQSATMMLCEGFEGVLELIEGDERRARATVWPALTVEIHGVTFRHREGLWHMDDVPLTPQTLDQRLVELEEILDHPATVGVDLAVLGLPEPTGAPLPDGTTVTVTNLAGQRYAHESGQVMGDPFEASSPEGYRARPFVLGDG